MVVRGNQFVQLAVKQLAVEAAEEIGEGLSKVTSQFFETLGENLSRRRQKDAFRKAHQNLADGAKDAVVESYDSLIGNRPHLSYREGSRLTGRMRDALVSENWIQATESGIKYIDVDVLDAAAAHWYRLAFGAGPRGRPTLSRIPITFAGVTIEQTAISTTPSEPFLMPRGGFLNVGEGDAKWAKPDISQRGKHPFYPTGRSKATIPAQGFPGRNFFQAGITYIGRNIEKEYEPIINRAIELSGQNLGVAADIG